MSVSKQEYVDPLNEMERWFFNLPSKYLERNCHCGSGKPVLYWSPDDGTGCNECAGYLFAYIPSAVVYNIVEKFGLPDEIAKLMYDKANSGDSEGKK